MAAACTIRYALLLLAGCCARPASAAPGGGEIMKGMCYGPSPLKGLGLEMPSDDFMAEAMKPMWGPRGRGDLQLMRSMGANTVRLYGNDPQESHRAFLDEAHGLGLSVVPGLSDWPFMQMEGNCAGTNYNCYSQIKDYYVQRLRNGWLSPEGGYHPAIKQVVVMNEADLKLGNMNNPVYWTRALISAIDGMLDAEAEVGVHGALANFTATFSFGVCWWCYFNEDSYGRPGLAQMVQLRRGMFYPREFSYTPRNNLAAVYAARFTNSFNTQNPSTDMGHLILDKYEVIFPSVPLFIGEFHAGTRDDVDQQADMLNMVAIARSSPLLQGFAFFEWQVRHDKGGEETKFGMFSLGDHSVAPLVWQTGPAMDAWCLVPVRGLHDAVAAAFGGESPDATALCQPHPDKVPLNRTGFEAIRALANEEDLAAFVARAVRHVGGRVVSAAGLADFSASLDAFADLAAALLPSRRSSLSWASFDALAPCRADRLSDATAVGRAIQKACSKTWFNCGDIPAECGGDVWDVGDYVLSVLFNEQGTSALEDCYFDGAATAEVPSPPAARCVVTRVAATTMLTDEGYQAVLGRHDADETAAFIRRVILERLGATVTDGRKLASLASDPPASLFDVLQLLKSAQWLCFDTPEACASVATHANLTSDGFQLVLAQESPELMAQFVARVAAHFGGRIVDNVGLLDFSRAAFSATPPMSFEQLVALIGSRPRWALWEPERACVLDRNSTAASVGLTLEVACTSTWFQCANLPAECAENAWDSADYVLSVYADERGGHPLPSCLHNGALIFSRASVGVVTQASPCRVTRDPSTTPLTDEGFQAIARQRDAEKLAEFVNRFATQRLGAELADEEGLWSFVSRMGQPPSSLYELERALRGEDWLCFPVAERGCVPNAAQVPLTEVGFRRVFALGNSSSREEFLLRVVAHFGGKVVDAGAFAAFVSNASTLLGVTSVLDERPQWARWQESLACTVPAGQPSMLHAAIAGLSIEYACLRAGAFNCAGIPQECRGSVWDTADYALSAYALESAWAPAPTCYYNGSLIFSRPRLVAASRRCLITEDPETTPITDEGYQAILRLNATNATATFIRRVAERQVPGGALDEAILAALAARPPASMFDLEVLVWQAVRGSRTEGGGNEGPANLALRGVGKDSVLAWRPWAFLALGIVVAVSISAAVLWVCFHREPAREVTLPRRSRPPATAGARPGDVAMAGLP